MIRLADSKATSQERLKREFFAFLQELCRHRPLLLFLEDVHWTDTSTIDLLAYIATRFESLPMLVVVTYRAGEMVERMHPLMQLKLDLEARGSCRELSLQYLSKADVVSYLALEFPEHRLPPTFAEFLWQRTEGNPLFMVDLVRDLRDRKIIVQDQGRWILSQPIEKIGGEVPASVRSMIQRKIDSLSEPDRRLLQAASVEGAEFHSVVLAAAISADAAEVEERLENIERIHFFVQRIGEKEFPDGTLTLHLRFVHALYQNALYAMLSPTRRTGLSAATANTLLRLHPGSQGSVAHQVALLFESARDFSRAAEFFQIAAERAAGVFANQEAATLARKGLEMLAKLPPSPEKTQKGAGPPDHARAGAGLDQGLRQPGGRTDLYPRAAVVRGAGPKSSPVSRIVGPMELLRGQGPGRYRFATGATDACNWPRNRKIRRCCWRRITPLGTPCFGQETSNARCSISSRR